MPTKNPVETVIDLTLDDDSDYDDDYDSDYVDSDSPAKWSPSLPVKSSPSSPAKSSLLPPAKWSPSSPAKSEHAPSKNPVETVSDDYDDSDFDDDYDNDGYELFAVSSDEQESQAPIDLTYDREMTSDREKCVVHMFCASKSCPDASVPLTPSTTGSRFPGGPLLPPPPRACATPAPRLRP